MQGLGFEPEHHRKKKKLHSSPSYVKYTLLSHLIQNILENILLSTLERSLNYILHPSYVKIYNLVP